MEFKRWGVCGHSGLFLEAQEFAMLLLSDLAAIDAAATAVAIVVTVEVRIVVIVLIAGLVLVLLLEFVANEAA